MGKPILWALGLLAVALLLLLYDLGAFGKEGTETLGNQALDNAIGMIYICLLLMLASNIVVLLYLAEWASGIDKATERDWIGTICNTEIKQHEAEKHEGNG